MKIQSALALEPEITVKLPSRAARFAGVNNFAPEDAQVEKALLDNGITRDHLAQNWGVKLWRMIAVPQKVFLYLDAGQRPGALMSLVSSKAFQPLSSLEELLKKTLQSFGDINIKYEAKSSGCCLGACRGCAASPRSEKHSTWLG